MILSVLIAYVTGKYGEEPVVSWGALFVDFVAWYGFGSVLMGTHL